MEHKIIQTNIDLLIFAEYNPRQLTKEQYKHLKDSITRFGLVDPIIVNKNKDRKNVIIGGHQRVKVAKDMDIKLVPVVELDLSYDQERELNVRLNKNTGQWDWDQLANLFEIDELKNWGFDESQLVGLADLDYSILEEDNDIDKEVEELKDGTRRGVVIEFKLEDYEEANAILKKIRETNEYLGGVILNLLRDNCSE